MFPLIPILVFLSYTAMVVVTPFLAVPLINNVLSSPRLLGYEPLPTLDAGPVTEATVVWFTEFSVRLHRTWHMALMGWRGETPTPDIIYSLIHIDTFSWNYLDPLEQLGHTLLIMFTVLLMMSLALLVIYVHSKVRNRTSSKVPSKVAIRRHAHSYITTAAAATTIAAVSACIPDIPLTSPVPLVGFDDVLATEVSAMGTLLSSDISTFSTSSPRSSTSLSSSDSSIGINARFKFTSDSHSSIVAETAITEAIPTSTSEETRAGVSFSSSAISVGTTPRSASDSSPSIVDTTADASITGSIPIETSEEETKAGASFGGGDFSTPRPASDSIAETAITESITANTSEEVTIARSSSQKYPGHIFSPRSSTAAVSMSSVFSNSTNVGYVGKERSAKSMSSNGLRHPAMVVLGGVGREGMLFNTAENPVDLTYGLRDAQIDELSSRPRQGHVGGLIASGLGGQR